MAGVQAEDIGADPCRYRVYQLGHGPGRACLSSASVPSKSQWFIYIHGIIINTDPWWHRKGWQASSYEYFDRGEMWSSGGTTAAVVSWSKLNILHVCGSLCVRSFAARLRNNFWPNHDKLTQLSLLEVLPRDTSSHWLSYLSSPTSNFRTHVISLVLKSS